VTERPTSDDPTIGRLVADASRDISSLISKEIELAKTELKVSVQAGGIGIALFAAAGFLILLGVIFLSIALGFFIHWLGLGYGVSFLLVFALYLLLAGLLGFIGFRKVKQVKAPEKAIAQGREIPKALKGQS
jgi:putative superfamily III holin-X